MIPLFSNSVIFSFGLALRAIGAQHGVCCTAGTVGSISMWYSPGKHPRPSKTSAYSSRSASCFSLEVPTWCISLIVIRPSFLHVSPDKSGFCVPEIILKLSLCLLLVLRKRGCIHLGLKPKLLCRSFTLTVTFNRLNEHTGTSTFIGTRIQQNNTRLTIATKGNKKINMVN